MLDGIDISYFTNQTEFVLRIFVSTILAGIIGYERELSHKPAGLRTHIFVGMGACLFTIASFYLLPENLEGSADVTRIAAGIVAGIALGALKGVSFEMGPTPVNIYRPVPLDFLNALLLLVIPQIPLSLSNAIIGTADTCRVFFGDNEHTKRVHPRALATGMGLINIVTGFIGAMPMCHGAGGVAAHYRFGARTGGSNLMIGVLFLIIALI